MCTRKVVPIGLMSDVRLVLFMIVRTSALKYSNMFKTFKWFSIFLRFPRQTIGNNFSGSMWDRERGRKEIVAMGQWIKIKYLWRRIRCRIMFVNKTYLNFAPTQMACSRTSDKVFRASPGVEWSCCQGRRGWNVEITSLLSPEVVIAITSARLRAKLSYSNRVQTDAWCHQCHVDNYLHLKWIISTLHSGGGTHTVQSQSE